MPELLNTSVTKNGDWISVVDFRIIHPLNKLVKNNGLISIGGNYSKKGGQPTNKQIIEDAFKKFVEDGGSMKDVEIIEVYSYSKSRAESGHSGTAQP